MCRLPSQPQPARSRASNTHRIVLAAVLLGACEGSVLDVSPEPSLGSPTCGNGAVDLGEVCDGRAFEGATCASLGLGAGALVCSDDCGSFDASGCSGASCGNGTLEATEACDGNSFAGASCVGLGLRGGVLRCSPDCGAIDTSGCFGLDCPEALAGALVGTVLSGFSVGFGDDVESSCGGAGLEDLAVGWEAPGAGTYRMWARGDGAGALVVLAGTCGAEELACAPFIDGQASVTLSLSAGDVLVLAVEGGGALDVEAHLLTCGDGVAGEGEACDGDDVRGRTCEEEGYLGGTLACAPGCVLDTRDCQEPLQADCCLPTTMVAGCQDPGVQACVCAADIFCCEVQWDEACVAKVGELGCGLCDVPPECGDGTLDPACPEPKTDCCEPGSSSRGCADSVVEACVCALRPACCTELWSSACVDLVSGSGCGSCTSATCGDGVAESGELCDGADLQGHGCEEFGGQGGALLCMADCQAYDFSACAAVTPCCRAHDFGGCRDRAAQACVCAQSPTCCDLAWTDACVEAIDALGCGHCP